MDMIRLPARKRILFSAFILVVIGLSTFASDGIVDVFIHESGFQPGLNFQKDDYKKHQSRENGISTDSLVRKYKPENVLDYDDARKQLYLHIYNINDTVTCMYSGYRLPLSRNSENPVGDLMKVNLLKSIITEHSYPKSKGAKHRNAKSDMHHLFPVRLGVNVARFNHPFGDVKDELCEAWYMETGRYTSKPENLNGKCAKKGKDFFEPRDEFKGNVARAVFYFYTMYREEANSEDSAYFEIQRQSLLRWHREDPVDELELKRTYMIASFQSGKPNPFVVDPSLAEKLYSNANRPAK